MLSGEKVLVIYLVLSNLRDEKKEQSPEKKKLYAGSRSLS